MKICTINPVTYVPDILEDPIDDSCVTATGEGGNCVDVHSCPIVLRLAAEKAFDGSSYGTMTLPRLCQSNSGGGGGSDAVFVCCPKVPDSWWEKDCGLAFPLDRGIEKYALTMLCKKLC
jgi:hypothetical protein